MSQMPTDGFRTPQMQASVDAYNQMLNSSRIPRQQPGMMRKGVGDLMPVQNKPFSVPGWQNVSMQNNKWQGNMPQQNPYGPTKMMPRGGMPQPGQGLGRMNRERVAQGLKRINPMNPGRNQVQIQPLGQQLPQYQPAIRYEQATPMPRGGFAQTGGPDPLEGLLSQINSLYGV